MKASGFMQQAMQTPALQGKDPAALAKKMEQHQKDPEAIKEVAKQFESIFMHQVFKSMRSTLPKDGLMSGGFGEDVFTDMLDQEYANMAISSNSMGLAETIAAQLGGSQSSLETALAPVALRKLKASQAYAAETTSGQWSQPVSGTTERGFGMHRLPTERMARFHDGIDLNAPVHSPVHASRAGIVSQVKQIGEGSYRVDVRHGDGFESSYEGVDRLQIGVGDRVMQGSEIGKISPHGGAHGTGLHFEIRHRGRSIDPTPLWKENK